MERGPHPHQRSPIVGPRYVPIPCRQVQHFPSRAYKVGPKANAACVLAVGNGWARAWGVAIGCLGLALWQRLDKGHFHKASPRLPVVSYGSS